jgi:hypothetical protein
MQIPIDHETLFLIFHVEFYVDFSSMIISFGPCGPHLLVLNELGRSRHFRQMRDLQMQGSWAFKPVCQVALTTNLRFLCMDMPKGSGASRMAPL